MRLGGSSNYCVKIYKLKGTDKFMKVSDIMLDLATGDASIDDAYIMESVGKVKVSSAIFDASVQLNNLPNAGLSYDDIQYIQEAAMKADLPVSEEGTLQTAHRAVLECALATGNAIKSTARKNYNQIAKKTDYLTAAVAKWTNAQPSDVIYEYAANISKSVISANNGKSIQLLDERIVDAESMKCITESYIQGIASTLKSYGLSSSGIFDLPSVQALGIDDNSGSVPKTPEAVSRKLDTSCKLLDMPEPTYTREITLKDIGTYVLTSDAIKKASAAFVSAAPNIDKGAEKLQKTVVRDPSRITDAEKSIISGGKFTKLVSGIADASSKICSMIGDTASALTSSVQRFA